MPRRTMVLAIAFAIATTAVLAPTAADARTSDVPPLIIADLDGIAIPATEAGDYFCHDFAFPHVHCFAAAERLEQALRSPLAVGTLSVSYGTSDYLTVYSSPSYGGSYAHLSQNYDALWVIGWNDRIRSLKVRNSARGSFHVDWYAGGARYDFCCNSEVPYLSSTYDSQFSSVYRG